MQVEMKNDAVNQSTTMDNRGVSQALLKIYRRLFVHYGPQHWWPAEEPFEIVVGAILTQSVAWSNVEKAITGLRSAGALSPEVLRRLPIDSLARLVYPSGHYNAKALKLKSFAHWLEENFNDDLNSLFDTETGELRQQLLSVHGIGPETADSIMLYAASKPVFVIDAYTKRIISRLGLTTDGSNYRAWQAFFMDNLPANNRLFNEYHALLVCLGKDVCRRQPACHNCCLNNFCLYRQQESAKEGC
jgi:endonuclease-3 related protein